MAQMILLVDVFSEMGEQMAHWLAQCWRWSGMGSFTMGMIH